MEAQASGHSFYQTLFKTESQGPATLWEGFAF